MDKLRESFDISLSAFARFLFGEKSEGRFIVPGAPKSLFLYRRLTKKSVDTVINGEIYVPCFSAFNDPFDCRPVVSPASLLINQCFPRRQDETIYDCASFVLGEEKQLVLSEDSARQIEEANSFATSHFKGGAERMMRIFSPLFETDSEENVLLFVDLMSKTHNFRSPSIEKAWAILRSRPETIACLNDNGFEPTSDGFARYLAVAKYSINRDMNGQTEEGTARMILGETFYNLVANYKEPFSQAKQEIERGQRAFLDTIGIRCFCERKNDRLMWSHYAGDFSGFCIEYDLNRFELLGTSNRKVLFGLFPIQYQSKRPGVIPSDIKIDSSVSLCLSNLHSMLCKSTEWRYEREWRLLVPRRIKDERLFLKPKAVYLGANMQESWLKKRLVNRLREKGVPIKKMVLSSTSYALKFTKA